MERKIAHFLSYLFHPFWMPSYMVILLFFIHQAGPIKTSVEPWLYIAIIVIINTLIIPISLIYIMKRMGIIKSMSLENKQERLYPFIVTAVFYFTTWFVFSSLNIFPFLALIFSISATLAIVAAIINIFWKISIHSISMGAISIAVIFLTASHFIAEPWLAYITVFFAGLVGFSRLKLQQHSSLQIYLGYLMGAIVVGSFVFMY